MNPRLIEHPVNNYVALLPGDGLVAGVQDALDLVGACSEHQAYRLLLHGDNLPDDFFNLRTGLAGEILLMFTLYGIKLALVLPPERAGQGRFGEMALEANRGNQGFHVFPDRGAAEAWLTAEA